MRQQCTHVTKEDFIPAFRVAFEESLTESNIKGGFRGAGLIPFDPERGISALDLKLRTPTPQNSRPSTAQPWTSQTPSNTIQATSHSSFIKDRVTSNKATSPTPIFDALAQVA